MDESVPTYDAHRELAARRKDLERDFDDKARDLKAQHKRQADKLQQDRLDWETHRRTQQRELADRAEKVRRQEDNHKRDLEALTQARRELEQARAQARDAGEAKVEAKTAKAKESDVAARLAKARDLLAWFALLSGFGFLAVLAAGLAGAPTVATWLAAIGFALAVLLEFGRRGLAGRQSATRKGR